MTGTDELSSRPIGVLHSPYHEAEGSPIQGAFAPEVERQAEVFDEFAEGLDDIEGFSQLYLVYVFDRSEGYRLKVMPFRDDTPRGVLATRAPKRVNAIGLSIARLIAREGNVLRRAGVDFLDGTPLLDIKPYVPKFDRGADMHAGWLENSRERSIADGRFSQDS